MERNFKGIWIPAEIWLSKELTLQEKVFLVEIDSLDNDDGCFASNSYFAEFFGISKTRVSQVIKSLEYKGYINTTLEREDKEIVRRVIKCLPPSKYSKGGGKYSKEGIKYSKGGYLENCKDNNTIYNNTINNIINSSSSSSINNNINNSNISYYYNQPNYIKEYINKINPVCSRLEIEKLTSWLEDVDEDLIIKAINEAVLSNARNYKYINSILNRCLEQSITTGEQFENMQKIRERERQNGTNTTGKATINSTIDNSRNNEFEAIIERSGLCTRL